MKYSEVIDEDMDNMSDPIESDDDLEDIGDIGIMNLMRF